MRDDRGQGMGGCLTFVLAVAIISLFLGLPAFLVWQYDSGSQAVSRLADRGLSLIEYAMAGVFFLFLLAILLIGAAMIIKQWRTAENLPGIHQHTKETRIIERPVSTGFDLTVPDASAVFPEMIRNARAVLGPPDSLASPSVPAQNGYGRGAPTVLDSTEVIAPPSAWAEK